MRESDSQELQRLLNNLEKLFNSIGVVYKDGRLLLNEDCYGTVAPQEAITNPREGQIYFHIQS